MCRLPQNKQPSISALLNYVSNPYITQFFHCMKQKNGTHYPGVSQADDDSLSLGCWGSILDPVEQAAVKFT
jgi:hypothetical protein